MGSKAYADAGGGNQNKNFSLLELHDMGELDEENPFAAFGN